MPLQNRVAPDGTIFSDPARGMLMGNRGGQMHDDQRQLTGRRWVSKAWIACVLSYQDRHEAIMAPGHYTQLFFLDEATALAAGHRPCALCRRRDFARFMDLWRDVHKLRERRRVAGVDRVLHAERLTGDRKKRTCAGRAGELPSGTLVSIATGPQLLWDGKFHPWTPSGYLAPSTQPAAALVEVLTPPSILAILAAGYQPILHASARSMSSARSA